jgi:hypothetical protein
MLDSNEWTQPGCIPDASDSAPYSALDKEQLGTSGNDRVRTATGQVTVVAPTASVTSIWLNRFVLDATSTMRPTPRPAPTARPAIADNDHGGLAGTSGPTLKWMSWKPQDSGVTIFLAPGTVTSDARRIYSAATGYSLTTSTSTSADSIIGEARTPN